MRKRRSELGGKQQSTNGLRCWETFTSECLFALYGSGTLAGEKDSVKKEVKELYGESGVNSGAVLANDSRLVG